MRFLAILLQTIKAYTIVFAGTLYAHKLHLHFGDVTDLASLTNLISNIRPAEIYNLAAQSHVQVSFEVPVYTADAAGLVCATS